MWWPSLVNKQAYWKISTLDWICGGVSVLALALWLATGQGNVALVFSLLASIFSSIPTIVKSYKHPTTESPWDYLASLGAGIITILTIEHWNLANYGFPVYITIESLLIAALVLTPQRVHEETVITTPLKTTEPVLTGSAEHNELEPGTPQNATQVAQSPISTQHLDKEATSTNNTSTKSILGNLKWSQNPVLEGNTTLLEAHVLYGVWPIEQAEYIGSIDPGPGSGFPMAVQGNMVAATFVARVPKGTYPIAVRAKDARGVWTDLCYTELKS